MSSYKAHSLFSIILSFIIFTNPFYLVLSLIGGNLSDFDHEIKNSAILKIMIFGFFLSILLYFIHIPIYFGLILILLGIIFYFSKHRGFTHSIFGITIISFLIFLFILLGILLSKDIISLLNNNPFNIGLDLNLFNMEFITFGGVVSFNFTLILLSILIIILIFLFLNKKLFIPAILLYSIGILIMPVDFSIFNKFIFPLGSKQLLFFLSIFFSILVGGLSHLILDSFTPSGIQLFSPFSKKKYYKKSGTFILASLLLFSIYNIVYNFNFFGIIL
ncbi:metal-dependent hydrolase [Methanobrevibacter curvatus]|uniref:Inner membrane protein n=1 Tax=Methanobrevibacter curvatus TaxID=49547 RepID=A0A166C5K1_9EURY|nr:hypothetical protein MBCUR_06280 [Methanobrevibacter curvatus]